MSSGKKTRNSMGGFGLSSWNLLLHMIVLLLIMLAYVVESRKIIINSLEKPNTHNMDMTQKDPSEMVFFTEKDFKIGNKIPIYFPKKDPSSSPHLLPRAEADSIPFSSEELPKLLDLFSLDQGSPQAEAVEYTIRKCETEAVGGETKTCATSLESVLDFARGAFGSDEQFSLAKTRFSAESPAPGELRNYTISGGPRETRAPKVVACHAMPYPYLVYYCHYQESNKNKLYGMSLRGDSGEVVEAVAVCHMDTSHWSRDHASFRVLGVEPGTLAVCHFFTEDSLVWIPKSSSSNLV